MDNPDAPAKPEAMRRTRHAVPRSARRTFARLVDEHDAAEAGAELAPTVGAVDGVGAAELIRWRVVGSAWQAALRDEASDDVSRDQVRESYAYAVETTRARLRPDRAAPGDFKSAERAIAKAKHRAEECRTCGGLLYDAARGDTWDVVWRCDTRWCLDCLRAAMSRTMERWFPLFKAKLLPGFVMEMFTVGAWGWARNREDQGEYMGRLGDLARRMRRGVKDCAIPKRAWVGGLRTVECVPKEGKWWTHAHLVIVRQAFYAYGLSLTKMADKYRPGQPLTDAEERAKAVAYGYRAAKNTGEERAAASIRALVASASPEDRGAREVMRRCGLGEVGRHDVLSTEDDADAAGAYLRKIERYLKKVEKGSGEDGGEGTCQGYAWTGRQDIQRAMRGRRLVEAFGDIRGALAAPPVTEVFYDGEPMDLRTVGAWDYSDPSTYGAAVVARGDEEHLSRIRRQSYALDVVERWNTWADVGALVARFDPEPPPYVPPPPLARTGADLDTGEERPASAPDRGSTGGLQGVDAGTWWSVEPQSLW